MTWQDRAAFLSGRRSGWENDKEPRYLSWGSPRDHVLGRWMLLDMLEIHRVFRLPWPRLSHGLQWL